MCVKVAKPSVFKRNNNLPLFGWLGRRSVRRAVYCSRATATWGVRNFDHGDTDVCNGNHGDMDVRNGKCTPEQLLEEPQDQSKQFASIEDLVAQALAIQRLRPAGAAADAHAGQPGWYGRRMTFMPQCQGVHRRAVRTRWWDMDTSSLARSRRLEIADQRETTTTVNTTVDGEWYAARSRGCQLRN